MSGVENVDSNDDDSFIILGTSPGTSLDVKCGSGNGESLDKARLEDALKDLSDEANMAFKAHFQLGDCPSPASMMVASTIVNDVSSTEDLQKRFGELLDENLILKETLKQNNDSMKEQFLLIASCQEDMMRTQVLHKEKFEETKELVEKLRYENKKLKQDLMRKSDAEVQTSSDVTDSKSGPSSGLEFVTSPDDDTINKLTAQLELIEKQRRQVIVDNEKLTWQKESLEHMVDATSKERDELKEKLNKLELQYSSKDSDYEAQINNLKLSLQDLQMKLHSANVTSISSDEVSRRDSAIQQLEGKVSSLQTDLKNSQLRILELENVKLEFTKHRSGLNETVKIYKEQIHELHNRLKDAQTTVFQPARMSLSSERESSLSSSEYSGLMNNVKLYDRTLKHLAELMNALTNGLSDSLVETMGVVASLQDFKLERATVEQFRACLGDVKHQLERQHNSSLNYVVQVRNTLSIFEGIFKDYNELLKKTLTKQEPKPATPNVDALTTALLARGQELQNLEAEVRRLRQDKEETDLLKAQLDIYKTDFEAEREAREKMACEKENISTDLRGTQRKLQELMSQLDEVRRLNPDVFWSATSSNGQSSAPSAPRPSSSASASGSSTPRRPSAATNGTSGGTPRSASASAGAAKKMIYTCPKCMKFKSDHYYLVEDHLDYCLDTNNDPCYPM